MVYKPGQSGNPAGRPRGAVSRVRTEFLNSLREIEQETGKNFLKEFIRKALSGKVKYAEALFKKIVPDMTLSELDGQDTRIILIRPGQSAEQVKGGNLIEIEPQGKKELSAGEPMPAVKPQGSGVLSQGTPVRDCNKENKPKELISQVKKNAS
jgi:hypothetical protein